MKRCHFLFSIAMLVMFCGCNSFSGYDETPIVVEGRFMQYACGDDNDDVRINRVYQEVFNHMVGKDIDPYSSNGFDFAEYFYRNRSDEFQMTYKLKGRMSAFKEYGCDDTAPRFLVQSIERLDGKEKENLE